MLFTSCFIDLEIICENIHLSSYIKKCQNVSGYVCNHGSPSGERDTASPRGRYGERLSVTRVWRYIFKNTTCWPATAHDVTTGVPQYKCRREITSSASSSEACVRSMAQSLGGRSVSFPTRGTMVTYVTWDVPLHGTRTASLGVATGTLYPRPPCWGECKPISQKRRALSQLYQAKGVAPRGRLMAVSDIIPYGQKPELHTLKSLPAGCRNYRTQG